MRCFASTACAVVWCLSFTFVYSIETNKQIFEIDASGCTWATTPAPGDPNEMVFLKVLSLHRFYSTCTPMTCQLHRKFIYADDICLATRGQYFSKLECSLSSDMVWMSHFCRQWWLKPSAAKTISSVFHLHNTSATRKLSVSLDGQRLRHQSHPTWADTRQYTVSERTPNKDCRQAEVLKQLVDKASWFLLGR